MFSRPPANDSSNFHQFVSFEVWVMFLFVFNHSRRYFFCGSFVLFMFCVCHAFTSVHCCLMVTCRERAGLLALVCDVYRVFVTFPCGILGQVCNLIVSFPDLCHLAYFIYWIMQLRMGKKHCYVYQNLSYLCCSKTQESWLITWKKRRNQFRIYQICKKKYKSSPFDERWWILNVW